MVGVIGVVVAGVVKVVVVALWLVLLVALSLLVRVWLPMLQLARMPCPCLLFVPLTLHLVYMSYHRPGKQDSPHLVGRMRG